VTIAHTKLDDKAAVERLRRYWSERLDALDEMLSRAPKARPARRAASRRAAGSQAATV
jgi:hypothetical protein